MRHRLDSWQRVVRHQYPTHSRSHGLRSGPVTPHSSNSASLIETQGNCGTSLNRPLLLNSTRGGGPPPRFHTQHGWAVLRQRFMHPLCGCACCLLSTPLGYSSIVSASSTALPQSNAPACMLRPRAHILALLTAPSTATPIFSCRIAGTSPAWRALRIPLCSQKPPDREAS